jgi:hypothetical protein
VADPYVETVTRTRNESGKSTGSVSGGGTETSQDVLPGFFNDEIRDTSTTRTSRESRSGSFSERERETTRREITPMRDRLVVKETTRSSTSQNESEARRSTQSFNSVERRTGELFDRTSSGSSSESERRSGKSSSSSVSEQISERLYTQDPYAGGDQYSVELRLRPRTSHGLRGEARLLNAESSLADFVVRSAARERLNLLLLDFREAQFLAQSIAPLREKVEVLKADLQYWQDVRDSGALLGDRFQEKRKDLFEAELDLERAIEEAGTARAQLALDAGLADSAVIDLGKPGLPPLLQVQGLSTNLLQEIAMQNSPELGDLVIQQQLHRAELDVKRAARIPWLTFIAAEYGYEERYGEKYQDEVGIFAGVQLPVFTWMDRDLGAGERAALESVSRRRALVERRVAARLTKALQDLVRTNAALEHFRKKAPDVRRVIEQELASLPEVNPQIQKSVHAMKVSLVEIETMRIDHERRYAEALLGLEAVLGTGIDSIFAGEKAVNELSPASK